MIEPNKIKRIASHVGNRTQIKHNIVTEPYLLRGISSPSFLSHSRTKSSQQLDKFVEDLRILLSTEKGTLFGRPDYGTELIRYLFEPTVEMMGEKIRQEIISTVQESYPTVNLNEVNIEFIKHDKNYPEIINGIKVNLSYSINQNNLNQLISFNIMREYI